MRVFLIAAVLAAAAAAYFDWKKGEIPGRLSLTLFLAAPLCHVLLVALSGDRSSDASLEAAGASLLGAVVCALVPFLLYRYQAIGGGDLKFFLALGALLGPSAGIKATFLTFAAAALIAPGKLAYEGKLLQTLKNSFSIAANATREKEKQTTIEPEALTWFRLGPCMLLGAAATAFLEWRSE